MEHYHDFAQDSCIADGVSIAESLLYKDVEEFRTQEFTIDNSMSFVTDSKSSMSSTSAAPMNAVAAAAFGSAYSRTASGGIEELLVNNDYHIPGVDAVMNNEEEIVLNSISTPFCNGNIASSSCDSNYSKWNELVDKLVDSQEDIPSLMIETASDRNVKSSKNHDMSSAANVLLMRVNQLGDYSSMSANKQSNGRSPSSSSNGSSSMTAIGETGYTDQTMMRTHAYGSSSRSSSVVGCEFDVYNSPYHNMNAVNNWFGISDADVSTSGSREPEVNVSASNSNVFSCNRNDLKWVNNYFDNCTSETGAGGLHRVKTEPIFSNISSGMGAKSRLRPIVGKCSDDSATISSTSSAVTTTAPPGLSSMSLFNQSGGSQLLPMLRNTAPQMIESNMNEKKHELTTVSSLMATSVGSHNFSSGHNTTAGMINSSLSSVATPVFHITADSLRIASRSQLNPNAEKFVFVPPTSNNGSNTIIHQQQHPLLQQQHIHQPQQYHHGQTQHQQHQTSQQHHVSGASFFSVQAKQNYVNCNVSQSSLPGTSTTSGITSNSNCNPLSGNISNLGANVTGMTSASTMSSVPSALSHQFMTLNTISPVTFNFQSKFNILAEQRKSLDRERNRIEAELCRQYPGKRITTGVCGASLPPAVKSCNSSDRVDRELNTVLGNHARVVALIAKMEKLQNGGEPLPSHVHSTMECWLEGIRKCQARRKEELVNMTNRQRSGPRQQDEKDVVALTLALAELTEHMRRARTALWAALQMTHKDRTSSATEAFRFLDHIRRHGMMVLIPPYNNVSNAMRRSSNMASGNNSISTSVGDEGSIQTTSVVTPIVTTTHSLLSLP